MLAEPAEKHRLQLERGAELADGRERPQVVGLEALAGQLLELGAEPGREPAHRVVVGAALEVAGQRVCRHRRELVPRAPDQAIDGCRVGFGHGHPVRTVTVAPINLPSLPIN